MQLAHVETDPEWIENPFSSCAYQLSETIWRIYGWWEDLHADGIVSWGISSAADEATASKTSFWGENSRNGLAGGQCIPLPPLEEHSASWPEARERAAGWRQSEAGRLGVVHSLGAKRSLL